MHQSLDIFIPAQEDFWDEENERFISTKSCTLTLRHSLISISEWESRWEIPFLSVNEKTNEQLIDYIKCMTVTQCVDPNVYLFIPVYELARIQAYIDDDHTATFFNDSKNGKKKPEKKILTSEVIYYYMITLGIPVQFEKWHLGRLMTLIKVCNELNKEQDPKYKKRKLTVKEQQQLAIDYDAINERRKRELGTKG